MYGYDGVGNRLWTYQNPTNTTYTYGSYNRLTSAGSTSYTYDNDGNRLTQVSGGTTTKYNYDFERRLTSVSQGTSTLGNYTYSPLGERIQKVESGTTTTYLNKGISVLYEKAGTAVNNYVVGSNLLIAKLSGSNIYYFHQDALGSTRLVTTGSTTIFSTNYQPFGPQYGASGTDPTYKYTAKPQDSSTGLYYYASRYYDTTVGRFLSRDSAVGGQGNPQDFNGYSYVDNNPERFVDPTGHLRSLGLSTQQHCGWGGCNVLRLLIVEFNPLDVQNFDIGTRAASFIILVAAIFTSGLALAFGGWVVWLLSFEWWIVTLYKSRNSYVYLYGAMITRKVCGWWCVEWPLYYEIGVETDQLRNWSTGLADYQGGYVFKPVWNIWNSIAATWWNGAHGVWPPGY